MAKRICAMAVMLFVLSACAGAGREAGTETAAPTAPSTASSPATAAPVFGGLGSVF